MESWNSQTFTLLIIFLLFVSCLFVVNSSPMQNQMEQTAHEDSSSTLLNQPIQRRSTLVTDAMPEDSAFLAAHNKARLHAGEPPFIWDPKLAFYARRYAQNRSIDCDLIHSDGPFGENIFWGSGNQWDAAGAVELWVREHRFYDRSTLTCLPGKMCGHYTQVVWRDSVRLGCARVNCDSGDTFAVCSYDPPGNYLDENPFSNNNNV